MRNKTNSTARKEESHAEASDSQRRHTPLWCKIPSCKLIGSSRIARSICVDSVTGKLSWSVHPKEVVKSPCGSASTSSTFFPLFAKPMPRLTVVVVFPVPPFWFAMAITLHFAISVPSFLWKI